MEVFMLLLFFLPGIITYFEFIGFCIKGRRWVNKGLLTLAEIGSLICLPLLYAGFGNQNECCKAEIDTAAFSPAHQLTIGVIVIICLAAYIYSKFRSALLPPLSEVLLNVFLVIGVVLNVFICFHTTESLYLFFGPLPIIILFVLMIAENQRLFMENSFEGKETNGNFEILAWKVLLLHPLAKYPLLFIISLPVLIIIIAILLLFGQKPDSVVRAFTDTYRHGFSQWDYKCENVQCGGHYLCSVAANGHRKIVRPVRYGKRQGSNIICNRQLLISNAFEELVKEKLPFTHRVIRTQYNKVGNMIHKYYWVFGNKYLSDIVYVLMKPLELVFITTLYLFDRKPETRIAKQYLQ